MLTGTRLHEVQEVALEMVMLIEQQERGAARLDSVRAALLASGTRALADVFPMLGGPVAAAAVPHVGPESEPHPSLLDWSVPDQAEASDLEAWIASSGGGVATAGELDAEGWV